MISDLTHEKNPAYKISLPPASAVEVIETVPSVCLCVNTLRAEALDIWSGNLVQGLTLMISRTRLMVKVKGQGHKVKKGDVNNFPISVTGCTMLA